MGFFLNSVHVNPEDQNDVRDLYHPEMFDDQNPSSLLQVNVTKKSNSSDGQRQWSYSARHVTSGFFWTTTTSYASRSVTDIPPNDEKRYYNWCAHGSPYAATLEEALIATENGIYDFSDGKEGEFVEKGLCMESAAMQSGVGVKDVVLSDQSKTTSPANLELQEQKTLFTTKSANKDSGNLFFESLKDMTLAQITAYVLEGFLNAIFLADPPAYVAMEGGESLLPWLLGKGFPWLWSYICKSCEPFTWPRNLVNVISTLFNAASMSTETSFSMKDDSWATIGLLSAESIITMGLVEGLGALFEKPVEWFLDCLKINKGGNQAEGGWTLVRLFLSIYYIGAGTYWSLRSDLDHYQKQHSSS